MSGENIEDIYELSPAQQGMLFHALYDPQAHAYFHQLSYICYGDLDVLAFKSAWQEVLNWHPVLRTSFFWENLDELDKPLQIVHAEVELPWEQLDWRGWSSAEQQEQLKKFLQADRERDFDLAQAPLMRVTLIRLAEDIYRFIWSEHHLILDGWSLPLVLQEVFVIYEAKSQGREARLRQSRPYRDYITWLQEQDLSRAETYWRRVLKSFTASTPLGSIAAGQERYAEEGFSYHDQEMRLPGATLTALQSLASKLQLTLNTLVQGAWALLLSHYSGEQDIVYGVTVSGRPAALSDVESIVGMFINTLPMRVQVFPHMPLNSWLKLLQEQQAEMRQYEYSPLVQIQQWSDVPRGLPLFESILVFENFPMDFSLNKQESKTGQRSLTLRGERAIGQTNYPLTIAVVPQKELVVQIGYDRRRFEDATITRMLQHIRTLLESFIAHSEQRLADLAYLSLDEWRQILIEWNATEEAYPLDQCLHSLVEAQAARTPSATAVERGAARLTYQALNERANQLAHFLRTLGVGPEVRVGIYVEPSLEMTIGLLGILKAGGAYIPLDPAYPADRLAFMLQDADIAVLLTQQHLLTQDFLLTSVQQKRASTFEVHAPHIVCLDRDWPNIACQDNQNLPNQADPLNLAYIMYTSGSTGKPKGALIVHSSLVNYTLAVARCLRLQASDRVLQFASLSFDVAMEELFPAWACGAAVILRPQTLSPSGEPVHTMPGHGSTTTDTHSQALPTTSADFLEMLARERITLFEIPTSYWHELVYETSRTGKSWPASLRLIIVGGEKALPERLEAWARCADSRRITLINIYGLTETTVTSSLYEGIWSQGPSLSSRPEVNAATWAGLPIGRPIANTQLYVLDKQLHPVPIGVPGELYIGGAGIARGYANRADITAERFVPNPFAGILSTGQASLSGSRLYKTGDKVRYLPDGNLEFLGRTDFQLKIRGFRLEPGEIEAVLCQHPDVRATAISLWKDSSGTAWLVAYVVPDFSHVQIAAPQQHTAEYTAMLRGFLEQHLPEYMLPSFFVVLENLPLTPTGKVDRGALPDPGEYRSLPAGDYVAPRTEVERAIATVWQEVLGLEKVGLYDNLFDLGAHSLLMIRAYSKLREVLGKDITMMDMFRYPTISSLAKYLAGTEAASPEEEFSFAGSQKRGNLRKGSTRQQREFRQRQRAVLQEESDEDE